MEGMFLLQAAKIVVRLFYLRRLSRRAMSPILSVGSTAEIFVFLVFTRHAALDTFWPSLPFHTAGICGAPFIFRID